MDHTLLQKYRIYSSKKLLPVVDFSRSWTTLFLAKLWHDQVTIDCQFGRRLLVPDAAGVLERILRMRGLDDKSMNVSVHLGTEPTPVADAGFDRAAGLVPRGGLLWLGHLALERRRLLLEHFDVRQRLHEVHRYFCTHRSVTRRIARQCPCQSYIYIYQGRI